MKDGGVAGSERKRRSVTAGLVHSRPSPPCIASLTCISLSNARTRRTYSAHSSTPAIAMDALKAEIASKRKALDAPTQQRPNKYMRRGDIEKLKEEEERKAREEKAAAERASKEREREKAKSTVSLHAIF